MMLNRRTALKNMVMAMGYTIAAPTLLGVLNSCTTEDNSVVNWHSVFLSPTEKFIVTYLANIIIPETNVKGAIQVNVPQFIDRILKDIYSETDQKQFKRGAKLFAVSFKNKFQKPIINGNLKELTLLLEMFFNIEEKEVVRLYKLQKQSVFNVSRSQADEYSLYKFLVSVRSLTMLGYGTSEYVGENVLSYDPIPGKYIADIPVKEIGNAWSLR